MSDAHSVPVGLMTSMANILSIYSFSNSLAFALVCYKGKCMRRFFSFSSRLILCCTALVSLRGHPTYVQIVPAFGRTCDDKGYINFSLINRLAILNSGVHPIDLLHYPCSLFHRHDATAWRVWIACTELAELHCVEA